MTAAVYTDGGVIRKNPSPHGGTWAWCAIDAAGVLLRDDSGLVTPADVGLPAVSNNLTELLAAVKAMAGLPDLWEGTIYTDSFVTLCRITTGKKFAGIPAGLVETCRFHRGRLRHKAALLGGHPNRAELAAGVRKDGTPVSQWNVRCDKECGRLAAAFMEQLQ